MKIFQELTIQGNKYQLNEAVVKIENCLRDGWSRDRVQENKISSSLPNEMYCFACSSDQLREAASLWLAFADDTLYVSNIVPDDIRELDFDQYNLILREFAEKFVKSVTDKLGLQYALTSDTTDIQGSVSQETAIRLQQFSKAANKSAGGTHVLDRTRWFAFLIAAHNDPAPLKADVLARWLEEEEGWPEDTAYELSINYENSRSLLRFYDENQL